MSLQIASVYKKYDDKQVLSGIDISIEEGTFLALLGPSGCGKTTLLQAIAGLTPVDGGTIAIGGTVVSEAGREVPTEKRNIGMVFQDFALWPHMNVYENVAFGLKIRGVKGTELTNRVMETLRIFHMEDYAKRYTHELSGGQKQRIAMARALAPQPKLILMDEPLSSLDAGLREEMRYELVRIFKQLRMTVVYVTHDQMEAMSMADEIVIMKDGKCEQTGTPEALYNQPVSEYVAKFMGPANILRNQENIHRFIRPDDIELVAKGHDELTDDDGHAQSLPGKVLLGFYQGQKYRYFVEVSGFDQPIEATHAEKIEPGAQVRVLMPSQKCRQLVVQN